MMSLRTSEGTDLVRYAAIAGAPLDPAEVESLVGLGLVRIDGDRLQATKDGRAVLNALITALLPE